MTRDQFKKELDKRGYKWREEGEWIIVEAPGDVDLNPLVSIPDNVQFNNRGGVYLSSLESIPDNVQFLNGGHVSLWSLKSIRDNAQFNNGGGVYLSSLESIPDNVQFNNRGAVGLDSLESIPINSDPDEMFSECKDIRINFKWLDLKKNIPFPDSRWNPVRKLDIFKKFLEEQGLSLRESRKNSFIIVEGTGKIKINQELEIPEKTIFRNKGEIVFDLYRKIKIGEDCVFENDGDVQFGSFGNIYWEYKIIFPNKISFSNDGDVWLNSSIDLDSDVDFRNSGSVRLFSLKILGDNLKFRNKGRVFLNKMEKIEIFDHDEIFGDSISEIHKEDDDRLYFSDDMSFAKFSKIE